MLNKDEILCTPEELVPVIHKFFEEIDLDPCSNPFSLIKAKTKYMPPLQNGLVLKWFGKIYVNPPWGYDFSSEGSVIFPWLCRCFSSYLEGAEVVGYLPYFTDSEWWKILIRMKPVGIVKVKESVSRIWENDKAEITIPTAFIYWGERIRRFNKIFSFMVG